MKKKVKTILIYVAVLFLGFTFGIYSYAEVNRRRGMIFATNGFVSLNRNDEQRAAAYFNKAVILNPHSQIPHLQLAGIYGRQRNIQLAIEEYNEQIKVEPENEAIFKYEIKKIQSGTQIEKSITGSQVLKEGK